MLIVEYGVAQLLNCSLHMHADVSAVSVKREADDVTECSHDDLSATTTGEFAAVSRL